MHSTDSQLPARWLASSSCHQFRQHGLQPVPSAATAALLPHLKEREVPGHLAVGPEGADVLEGADRGVGHRDPGLRLNIVPAGWGGWEGSGGGTRSERVWTGRLRVQKRRHRQRRGQKRGHGQPGQHTVTQAEG